MAIALNNLNCSILGEENSQIVAIQILRALLCSKKVEPGKKKGVNPIGFIYTQHSVSNLA